MQSHEMPSDAHTRSFQANREILERSAHAPLQNETLDASVLRALTVGPRTTSPSQGDPPPSTGLPAAVTVVVPTP